MKPKLPHRVFLALASSSLLAVSSASAQSTLYWDGGTTNIAADGNNASGGGTGTWNTTLLNWDAGVAPHVAWDNTSPFDTAVFGGTAGTVTLGTSISVDTININTAGYAINASATNQLTVSTINVAGGGTSSFGAAGTVNIGGSLFTVTTATAADRFSFAQEGSTNSVRITLNGDTGASTAISGPGFVNFRLVANNTTGGISISGGSTVLLNNGLTSSLGTNNLTINGGVVQVYTSSGFSRALGTGASQVQITGGTSGFASAGAVTLGASEIVWGSGVFDPTAFVLENNSTLTNNLDLAGATRTVSSRSGTGTISGLIRTTSGTAGLTKTGAGELVLSNTGNSYNGTTTVSEGTLTANTTTALSGFSTSGRVSVSDGATIAIRTGAWTAANIDSLRGAATWAAEGSRLGINTTTGNFAYNSDITEVLSISKLGTNTLTLGGNNSYSGATVIAAGTLEANSATALGNGGNITFTGGTLQYTAATASATWGSRIKNSTSAVSINTNGQSVDLSGIDNTNVGGLTKNGTGTLTLGGTNTYTGATTFANGTLKIVGSNALGSGTLTNGSANSTLHLQRDSGFTIANAWNFASRNITNTIVIDRETAGAADDWTFSSGLAQLSGNTMIWQKGANVTSGTPTVTLSGGLPSSDSTAGTIKMVAESVNLRIGNISNTRARIMELAGDTTGNEVYGNITQNNTYPSGLNKTGTGTWTLSGTNAYTNGTTVTEGILNTTRAAALASYNTAGKVVINGGTLGVQVGGAGWTTTQVDTMLTNATKTSGALGIDTTNGNLTQWTAFTTTNLGSTIGLTKLGSNTLTLDQANTYTGVTNVNEGTLLVNGSLASSSVVVNSTLGGSGVMANATISGTGSINPGNSPGVLTASATDPTGGLDYNFEFTAANTLPTWNAPTASVNDVLRLTSATPFTANLDAGNMVSIYLDVLSLSNGDVFTGGFFTDNNATFLSVIQSATFQYFLQDADGAVTYNGESYNLYSGPLTFGVDTISQTANFGAGDINGYVTQFTVIPEPGVALLSGLGLLLLLRRRRY